LVHVNGAANIAIGSDAALRASFNVIRRDGYLSDGTDDDVESAGRIRYAFQPNDDLSVFVQYRLRPYGRAGEWLSVVASAPRRPPMGSDHVGGLE